MSDVHDEFPAPKPALGDDDGDGGEDDDAGDSEDLISFTNLENVLKQIIGNARALEEKSSRLEEEIRDMKSELSRLDRLAVLEELCSDLGMTVERMGKRVESQKGVVAGLEGKMEQNVVMLSAMDKKQEKCGKDITAQEKFIRELQDAMMDKVCQAELDIFEAKFAGYATQAEHQHLVGLLGDFARADVTESIVTSIKQLGTRFDDYVRTAKVCQELQELRDWVSSELLKYPKLVTTQQRFQEVTTSIQAQGKQFEALNNTTLDNVKNLADRTSSIYQELKAELGTKAVQDDLDALAKSMVKYAAMADIEAVQQDLGPKVKFCVDTISQFDAQLRMHDDAITRVDESLLDKALKYDVVQLRAQVESCMVRENVVEEFRKMREGLDWLNDKLDKYVAGETDRFNRNKPPDYGEAVEDITRQLLLKAEKAELVELHSLKANRVDTDELCSIQELIQNQLEYLAVTTLGLSKLALLELRTGESKTVRAQQKSQVLMQAEKLWHWILHNEPPPNMDTLRPPDAPPPPRVRAGGFNCSKDGRKEPSHGIVSGTNYAEKRSMDAQKQAHLEHKLGTTLFHPEP